jgi:hypothetical protein
MHHHSYRVPPQPQAPRVTVLLRHVTFHWHPPFHACVPLYMWGSVLPSFHKRFGQFPRVEATSRVTVRRTSENIVLCMTFLSEFPPRVMTVSIRAAEAESRYLFLGDYMTLSQGFRTSYVLTVTSSAEGASI